MAATDYDFILTRNQIVESALRKIGAVYAGDSPRSEEMSAAVYALHALVEEWQNRHVFLWTLSPQTISLVASTANYALPTDPNIFSIEKAFYRNSAGDDIPLQVISYRDYQEITDKDHSGRPTDITVIHGTSPSVTVWPVPEEAGTLFYLGLATLKDFDSAGNIADFTKRWQRALVYGLAHELAPEYGLGIAERGALKRESEEAFVRAKGGDRDRPTSDCVMGAYDVRRYF